MTELTKSELELILTSLNYSRLNIERYSDYPSYEFKAQRLREVDDVRRKLIELKKAAK